MTQLSRRVRIGYALGGITTGTYGTVPGLILMPFLTDHLGVAAAMAGFIVFLPKAWDFIMNPIAGRISDRSQNPNGRRRPFVIRAGLLLAIVFVVLFFGPTHPPVLAGAWVLLLSIAGATVFAFYAVPFLSISAEITEDYTERTRLMTWRVAVFSLAILASGGTAPLLVQAADGVAGFRIMAVVMAVLILAGAIGVWYGTRGVPLTRDEPAAGKLLDQLKEVFKNREGRMLILTFIPQAIAVGMVLSGVVYVATHVVKTPGASTFVFVCFVLPAVVCAPIWQRIGARVGKKRGYLLSTTIMGVGFALLVMARTGSLALFLIASVVVGLGYAGAQIFPLAILPDVAAEDARSSGVNRIGMIAGVWSGFELLGLAIGPAVLGIVLAIGGYAETVGGAAQQTETAKWAIVIGMSIVPAILVFISLWPLSKYRLDGRLRMQHVGR